MRNEMAIIQGTSMSEWLGIRASNTR